MSFRALVIPEDPTYNGAILAPLVRRMLRQWGKRNAQVEIVTEPKLGGFEHAKARVPEIIEAYSHFDLYLLLVDADGKDRSRTLERMEHNAPRLVCCAALQEIGVWLLAGHVQKLSLAWKEIRADVSVKENVFLPFLKQHGDPRQPDGGRERLMRETLTNYRALLRRCPELAQLEDRVRTILA